MYLCIFLDHKPNMIVYIYINFNKIRSWPNEQTLRMIT